MGRNNNRPPRAPYKKIVEVEGLQYELQHPGAREWTRLQGEVMDFKTAKPDLTMLMDYCFEHVVTPVGHDYQPTLDDLNPAESEVWGKIFLPFLRGASVDSFAPSRKDESAGSVAELAGAAAESTEEKGGATPG